MSDKRNEKPAKRTRLTLTRETLRVSTGIVAGTGGEGCSSHRPTTTPMRVMLPEERST